MNRIIIIVGILLVVGYLYFYFYGETAPPATRVMVDQKQSWRDKILSLRSQMGFSIVQSDKWIDNPTEHAEGADTEQKYKDFIKNNNLTIVEIN